MSAAMNEKELNEGRFFGIISYLLFLCIVSLLLKKDNKFSLYHAKQGLVLFVFEVGAFILSILPFLGGIIRVLAGVVFLLVSLWSILQVLMGRCHRIPVISEIADNISL